MAQPLTWFPEQNVPSDLSDDGVWGPLVLGALAVFDRASAGNVTKSVAGADVTLTDTESQHGKIFATGSPGAARKIFVPAKARPYQVTNNLGNPATLSVQVVGSVGAAIQVPQNCTVAMYCTGSTMWATTPAMRQNGRFSGLIGNGPGISFEDDAGAGIGRQAGGVFIHAGTVSSVSRAYAFFSITNTATDPAIQFTNDNTTYGNGFWFPANGTLAWSTGGVEKFRSTLTEFLFGRTSNADNVEGLKVNYGGTVVIERNNGGCLQLSRMGAVGPSETGAGRVVQFYNGGPSNAANEAGSIRLASSSSVSFNTTSDRDMKDDICDPGDLWGMVHAVKARLFRWKCGDGGKVLGIVAQEAYEPWKPLEGAIMGHPDRELERDGPMGADYGRITPMLLWAVQSLDERLRKMEAEW